MLEKEFVPYQESLELKKLGFNEPCFGYFILGQLFVTSDTVYNSLDIPVYKAPTFSQAFRWFRENHNLHSNISSWRSNDNLFFYHEFEIYSLTSSYSEGDEYPTYEEAELACLRKLIEIVKGGNK